MGTPELGQVAGLLKEPVQQLDELLGLGSTLQSLLHPTGDTLESNGPLSSSGPVQHSVMKYWGDSQWGKTGILTVWVKVLRA